MAESISSPPPSPLPPPGERTEDMHAAVRRRALPVAIGGAITGIIGVVLTLVKPITPFTPPDFVGMNLQFCAILVGAGIFFYAKPTPRTGAAQAFSMLAIILGLGGTIIYANQAIKLRTMKEQYELDNVAAIARGAKEYAKGHEGAYPPNLLVLLEAGLIKPKNLRSPYTIKDSTFFDRYENEAKMLASRDALLQVVEAKSDYLYVGGDLRTAEAAVEKDLLVAFSNTTIMRVSLAICAADGVPRFIRREDASGVMEACNKARAALGLGALRPPQIIQNAMDEGAATRRR
jgi:hypothetical protein